MIKAKKKKLWIWIIVAAVIIIGVVVGAIMYLPNINAESVYVYSIADGLSGMANYYEGSGESSGQVTTDKVQPVYLSATQTVTEIMVEEGQSVKKGDVLLTYDTTLGDIELQRKWLSVEQDKVDLQAAKRELAVINSYVPIYYMPEPTPDPNAEPETEISDLELEGKDYVVYKGKGDTSLTPLYCWLRSKAMIDELMIEALFYGKTVDSLYVVFQHTEEDSNEGDVSREFGLKFVKVTSAAVEDENGQIVSPGGTVYRFTYFTPTHGGGGGGSNIIWNSGYTATEIYSMRVAKQAEIKELEFSIKMGEAEYRIMEKEADDGKIVAQFDGTVQGLIDRETAQMEGLPLMKVSGGGGYYVMGSVSELDLESISVGQKVDVMSWDTGMSYEGTIVEIQPFPQEEGNYYYGGSQNVSYYPYKVFIDESAMLQDGYYVSTTLRQGESEGQQGSLYVNNAFVVSEGASTYVYVRGEDGLLVKRRVRLGGMLWGEYSKVIEGISEEDYLAFPYDKEVKQGAPTQEGTWETLYGY